METNSWISWLFKPFQRKKNEIIEKDEAIPVRKPSSFSQEIERLTLPWKRAIPTRNCEIGESIQISQYKLTKTNESLFRWEGADFNILVAFGSSFFPGKDGIRNGILFCDEGFVNRMIQKGLESWEEIEKEIHLPEKGYFPEALPIFASWPRFWREQVVLRVSPNHLALLILVWGKEMQKILENTLTNKQVSLVRDELYYLGFSKEQENPYEKNSDFFGFPQAILQWEKTYQTILIKKEKEDGYHRKRNPRINSDQKKTARRKPK